MPKFQIEFMLNNPPGALIIEMPEGSTENDARMAVSHIGLYDLMKHVVVNDPYVGYAEILGVTELVYDDEADFMLTESDGMVSKDPESDLYNASYDPDGDWNDDPPDDNQQLDSDPHDIDLDTL